MLWFSSQLDVFPEPLLRAKPWKQKNEEQLGSALKQYSQTMMVVSKSLWHWRHVHFTSLCLSSFYSLGLDSNGTNRKLKIAVA